ncbi:hypothetical protein BDN71DRAFT_1450799 [Pleurotus eryngii]|uniref:Uncharacterized protein n=1 Tax=Pleurotus eryngii TaxID=5323 RepID=A0A9P6D6K1_PLEER|nr:hypothetical protein BDN71DRAFT_1450799 [Pleurotus eryngii]
MDIVVRYASCISYLPVLLVSECSAIDTIYGCQDGKDGKDGLKAGIKSTTVLFASAQSSSSRDIARGALNSGYAERPRIYVLC